MIFSGISYMRWYLSLTHQSKSNLLSRNKTQNMSSHFPTYIIQSYSHNLIPICHKKKFNIRNGRPTTSNKCYTTGGREDTQTDRLASIIMPKITPLQNYNGLQEAHIIFHTLTVMKTSCVVTLMWQISFFFLREESRLKFSCFA